MVLKQSNMSVGIGTTNPREKLEVNGNFIGTSFAVLYSHNLYYDTQWKYAQAGYGGATMRMIDSQVQFWNAPNNNASANSAATVTQRFTITEDGNVGIGTGSPGARLEVLGNSGNSANQWGNILYLKNSAGSNRLSLKDEQTSPFIPPGLWTEAGGGLSIGSQYEGIMFYASASGATPVERMRITSIGNVGIGVTNPSTKLVVYGDGQTDNDGIIHAVLQDPGATPFEANVFTMRMGGYKHHLRMDLNTLIFNATGNVGRYGSMKFEVGDGTASGNGQVTALQIKPGGNVGIGTTNPDYKFHVYGDAGGISLGPIAAMGFVDSGISFCGIKVGQKVSSPFSRTALSVEDDGTTILHVDGWNKRVGIGHTNPIGTLSVKTSGAATNGGNVGDWDSTFCTFGQGTGSRGGAIALGSNTSGLATYLVSLAPSVGWYAHVNLAHSWYWIFGTTQKMLLDSSGNLTITGTYSPSSDDRVKTNETYITNATETLLKLKPQKYRKHNFEFVEVSNELYENAEDSNILVQGAVSNTWVNKDDLLFDSTSNSWYERSLSNTYIEEAGLIAQDIWYDAPELRYIVTPSKDASVNDSRGEVSNDPQIDPDYSDWGKESAAVNYTALIPYLIKSNQELHAQLTSVLARLDALENA
jgi:hypothetical protein